MMLNRTMKTFIAIMALVAAVMLISGHVVNQDPAEDWILAGILTVVAVGAFIWGWQTDLQESRAIVLAEESVSLPKVQEWIISKDVTAPTKSSGEMTHAPAPHRGAAPDLDEPDDLTQIEGIGPKYREALISAGITTFDQLAASSQDELEQIVKDAGMRRAASMDTWIEQAKLAAAHDWEGLEKLQAELSGGRR